MRLILLILLLPAYAVKPQAQTDTSAVPFVAYWAMGDSYHFKVTKTKQQWKFEYEERFPTVFGKESIKGQGKLFVESVDFEQEYCVLVNQAQIDPGEAKAAVINYLRQMSPTDENIDETLHGAEMNILDNNRYAYFYFPGVPVFIETERKTTFRMDNEGSVSLEKTIIELID